MSEGTEEQTLRQQGTRVLRKPRDGRDVALDGADDQAGIIRQGGYMIKSKYLNTLDHWFIQVGPVNLEKESVPCMAARLKDQASGKPLKARAMPLEDDKGYGVHLLAMIDATLVEGYGPGGPMIDPGEYRRATRKLCSTGLWPNNSNPSNLMSKLAKYKGGTSTYTADNLKKVSWYAMAEVAAASNTGEHSCVIPLQFEMGQYRLYRYNARQESANRCSKTQVCRRYLDLGERFHRIGLATISERSSSKNGWSRSSNQHEESIQIGVQGGSGSGRRDRHEDDNALVHRDGYQLCGALEGDSQAQVEGQHDFKLPVWDPDVSPHGGALQRELEAGHCELDANRSAKFGRHKGEDVREEDKTTSHMGNPQADKTKVVGDSRQQNMENIYMVGFKSGFCWLISHK